MQRGPPLSENQMYSPIGQIPFLANATPNYSGMQPFQVGGADFSQQHIHYDMHAAHRAPSETTDTATQHLQSTAPLDLEAMAQHIQQLGANVASLAKEINELKFESSKQGQSQIDRLSAQLQDQHNQHSTQLQSLDERLSLMFQSLQENMATKHLHKEVQVVGDMILAKLQTLQDGGNFDGDVPSASQPQPDEKNSKDRRQPFDRSSTDPKPHDQQKTMVCIKGFFASLNTKRIFKLLTNYGTVLSLRRCGRGWAVATMKSAKEAKAAFQLHGHWGTAKRPGITVEWYKPNRNQAYQPPEGEEFIGSAVYQRMHDAPTQPRKETSAAEPGRQDNTKPMEMQPSSNTPPLGSKLSPEGQRNSTVPQLGKRRKREYGTPAVSPPAPSTATESLPIDLFDKKLTGGESSPLPPPVQQPADQSRGFGGGTEEQQPRGVTSQAAGGTNQSAGSARTGQEQREAQSQEDRVTLRHPPSAIPRTLTEQEVRATYSYDSASDRWIPRAKVLDQQLKGQHPPRQVKDVMGDGNCQPRAILATGQTKYSTLQSLKAAAKHHLSTNAARVREHLVAHNVINADDDSWDAQLKEHLAATSGHRAYGNEVSLGLYAILLRTEIRVYDAQSGSFSHLATPIDEQQTSQQRVKKSLDLGYRRHQSHYIYDSTFNPTQARADGHYWAIVPLPGNGVGSG